MVLQIQQVQPLNSAYVPSVSTTTNDVIALTATSLANAANSTTLTGALLFESMAAANAANSTISEITATTAEDSFYIVAYDNDDVMIFFADSGDNTAVLASEVNLVAHISGPNIAVGGLEAGDFILA